MQLKIEIDPEFVRKFQTLGPLLVKIADFVEQYGSLLAELESTAENIQRLMNEIQQDMNIAQTSMGSAGTRAVAAQVSSRAMATFFFIAAQVPDLIPTITEMSKLSQLKDMTPKQQKDLAGNVRALGEKLQALSAPEFVEATPSKKPVGRKSPRRKK